MPRYKFQCSACEHIQIVFMRMSDVLENCEQCHLSGTMEKQFDKFYSPSNINKNTRGNKVGSVTKEYIEKNREILKQQKEEIRSKEYEPA